MIIYTDLRPMFLIIFLYVVRYLKVTSYQHEKEYAQISYKLSDETWFSTFREPQENLADGVLKELKDQRFVLLLQFDLITLNW